MPRNRDVSKEWQTENFANDWDIESESDIADKPPRNEQAKDFMRSNTYAVVTYCEDKTTCRRSALLKYMESQTVNCIVDSEFRCDNCVNEYGKKSHLTYFELDTTEICRAIGRAVKELCYHAADKTNNRPKITLIEMTNLLIGNQSPYKDNIYYA